MDRQTFEHWQSRLSHLVTATSENAVGRSSAIGGMTITLPDPNSYHITDRGNERRDIYRDNRDRHPILESIDEMVSRFNVPSTRLPRTGAN